MKANYKGGKSLLYLFFQPWFICTIGMLFYCYNYFLRVSPSVMETDLMRNLHINAIQFGTLAAFYYYAYTPMQIPVGMIYDRFGARYVQFIACLTATLGVTLFIYADNFFLASIGRLLIGLGTAFAYIGVLKLASIWLPPNRFATIAGLTTAFGMLSAIFSDKYLTAFVQMVGYKNALHIAIIVGVILSVLIIVGIRNKPKYSLPNRLNYQVHPMSIREVLHSLRLVLMNKQIWIIGLIGCLFYMPASVFLDLWGIAYLKNVYHLSPDDAATAISWVFVGWIIAGPTIGALSDKIKRRCLPLAIAAVMSTVVISVIFYVPGISLSLLNTLFFLLGIFCGAHPLCFALGKENCPNHISGTAVAVTNTLIMLGGMIFQPVVGILLEKHSVHPIIQNGMVTYAAQDYTFALSVVPLGLIISIFLTFFLKETYCEAYEDTTAELPNAVRVGAKA